MKTHTGNPVAAENLAQRQANGRTESRHDAATLSMSDSRESATVMQRLQAMADRAPQALQLKQQAAITGTGSAGTQRLEAKADCAHQRGPASMASAGGASVSVQPPIQSKAKANRTGLPDQLKSGIESLSGMSMDSVNVHYNSDKPAQLQAHAYAQGSEIHLGAGQEQHLPHEAWHVVQQAQGRVRPTMQMKAIAVNDDPALENEADVMGAKAMNAAVAESASLSDAPAASPVVQGAFRVTPVDYDPTTSSDIHSIFTAAEFAGVLTTLGGNAFMTELNRPPNNAARARFTFANINANVADQPDIPSMANAIIAYISGGNVHVAGRLLPLAHYLVYALGAHAPTQAGEHDQKNFKKIKGGLGVVPSRAKGTPNSIPLASLATASPGAHAAVSTRNQALSARSAELDTVTQYSPPSWWPTARANTGMDGIRSPHTNNAGWLPASAVATSEGALFAAILAGGQLLQAGRPGPNRGFGHRLVNEHGRAASAAAVESVVDNAATPFLQTYFYNNIFFTAVNSRAERVRLAWKRYAEESAMANSAYIEFGGGGAATRIIWNYMTDRYYISAHYNWVDGFNPHFEVTGVPPSY